MKRYFGLPVALVILSVVLAGCNKSGGSSSTAVPAPTAEDPIILTFGTHQSSGSLQVLGTKEFARLVEERTNGRVKCEIYADASLGNEIEIPMQHVEGGIDMTVMGPDSIGKYVNRPEMSVWFLPVLYNSLEEARALIDNVFLEKFNEQLEGTVLKALFAYASPPRGIMNTKRPINTAEDLVGLLIRVPDYKEYHDIFALLGVNTVGMAWGECFTSIQSGVIEGVENDQTAITNASMQEVGKFYSQTSITSALAPVTINLNKWNSIPADLQQIILDCGKESEDYYFQIAGTMVGERSQRMLDAGMKLNDVAPEERAKMRAKVQPFYDRYIQMGLSSYIDEIEKVLASVRK
jgi:TRAP-type C4-dicarboxylate transport system substrate-binding protein